jgi:hypothetical protein
MSFSFVYIGDDKVMIPKNSFHAEELGWHCAGDPFAKVRGLGIDLGGVQKVRDWIRATFPTGTYRMFADSTWFLYERDATLCILRWS